MKRILALFGIIATLVHNIVYAWTNTLCIMLANFFPVEEPDGTGLPKDCDQDSWPLECVHVAGRHGALCGGIVDENCSRKNIHPAYKRSSTMKWLATCDPIDAVVDGMIGAGHGRSISKPIVTAVSAILNIVPYGFEVEVGKGFLIENKCVLLGISCVCPMKLMKKQSQQ